MSLFILYSYVCFLYNAQPRIKSTPGILYDDALASIPRSLTGLIYQKCSLPSAKQFVHAYFLSRQVDIRSMLKFVEPKRALLEMVRKYNRESPKSRYAFWLHFFHCTCISQSQRLLKETGRYSNSPVFVVGIFSGTDQIGEGFGSSLKMAEFRVCILQPSSTQLSNSHFTGRRGRTCAGLSYTNAWWLYSTSIIYVPAWVGQHIQNRCSSEGGRVPCARPCRGRANIWKLR